MLTGCALISVACGAAPGPYRTPDHWQKTSYVWPGEEPLVERSTTPVSHSTTRTTQDRADVAESLTRPVESASSFRGSEALFGRRCLTRLRETGVRFVPLRSLKGVENPVRVVGPLGGVTFHANDGRDLDMDCRLALALQELRPVFAELGLTRARFSGAYSYRTTRTGRLSHHAHGLAIDLHDFEFGRVEATVKEDFLAGVGCKGRGTRLNRLACALDRTGVFQELLTPDYNAAHRDHLHLAVPRRDQL